MRPKLSLMMMTLGPQMAAVQVTSFTISQYVNLTDTWLIGEFHDPWLMVASDEGAIRISYQIPRSSSHD